MTCYHCAEPERLREKARVAALEKQNTDLIAIVNQLTKDKLWFRIELDPQDIDKPGYRDEVAKRAGHYARFAIEDMLEDRRQLFEDYALMKLHVGPEYYQALNAPYFKSVR